VKKEYPLGLIEHDEDSSGQSSSSNTESSESTGSSSSTFQYEDIPDYEYIVYPHYTRRFDYGSGTDQYLTDWGSSEYDCETAGKSLCNSDSNCTAVQFKPASGPMRPRCILYTSQHTAEDLYQSTNSKHWKKGGF